MFRVNFQGLKGKFLDAGIQDVSTRIQVSLYLRNMRNDKEITFVVKKCFLTEEMIYLLQKLTEMSYGDGDESDKHI